MGIIIIRGGSGHETEPQTQLQPEIYKSTADAFLASVGPKLGEAILDIYEHPETYRNKLAETKKKLTKPDEIDQLPMPVVIAHTIIELTNKALHSDDPMQDDNDPATAAFKEGVKVYPSVKTVKRPD